MKENDVTCYTLISAQQALLGVITPNVRHISVEWDALETLRFRVHYDSQPSEDELEEMDLVTVQILADVPFMSMAQLDVQISTAPKEELNFLNRLVYSRKE